MNINTLKFSLIFLLLCQLSLTAQNRFKAGVAGGLNFSQINGDNQNGYNKIGGSLGIKGGFDIAHNIDLSAELFYNNKGSKPSREDLTRSGRSYLPTINLHTADMMIISNFYNKINPSDEFYKISFHIGFSYVKLLRSQTEVTRYLNPVPNIGQYLNQHYKSSDFGFIFGCSYFITPRLGATIRHTFSIRNLYTKPVSELPIEEVGDFKSFKPYYLSLHLFYNFILPSVKKSEKSEKNKKEANPLERL